MSTERTKQAEATSLYQTFIDLAFRLADEHGWSLADLYEDLIIEFEMRRVRNERESTEVRNE